MNRLIIPYKENRKKPILIALSTIREYSDMKFDHLGTLAMEFHNEQDVYYDVSDEVLPTLERLLRFDGFVYKLVDANSV